MASGRPALWTGLLALPFLAGGLAATFAVPAVPAEVGIASVAFAVALTALGSYVQLQAPPEPTLTEDETVVAVRYPSQRVAAGTIVASAPFLVLAVYLLFFYRRPELLPYVYPTVPLVVGTVLFSRGLYRYWSNALTCFYVTDERVICAFEFLSKVTTDLPLGQVRGIQEHRSVAEALAGLGNVRVASGAGGNALEVVIRDVDDATEFADELRGLV